MSAQRRGTAWDDQLFTVTQVNGVQAGAILLVEDVADPEKRGCTVVRIIMRVTLLPVVINGVTGRQTVSVGIALASDDAFAAGALPDPQTQADYPVGGWMYRDQVVVPSESTGVVPHVVLQADLRAQRKLDRSSLFFTYHSQLDEGVSFEVQLTGIIRVLYKLP